MINWIKILITALLIMSCDGKDFVSAKTQRISSALLRLTAGTDYPLIAMAPTLVCSDVTFHDGKGDILQGTKDCTAKGALKDLSPENIRKGVVINDSVTGTFVTTTPDCATDGATGCIATKPLFAAAVIANADSKILAGRTLAGVKGNVTLPAAEDVRDGAGVYGPTDSPITPGLPVCTSGGSVGCVANGSYKSQDVSVLQGSAKALVATSFSDASFGDTANATFEFWTRNGQRVTVARPADLLAQNIVTGASIFGVVGGFAPPVDLCLTNGARNCLAMGDFYVATPCTTEGESGCYLSAYINGVNSYKAINYDALVANAKYILTGQSLLDVAGSLTLPTATYVMSSSANYGVVGAQTTPTMPTCSFSGQSGCYVVGPSMMGVIKNDVNPSKMLTTLAIAGITGNVTLPSGGSVRTGTTFGVAGALTTGSLGLPSAGYVLQGTGYGVYNAGTGTYEFTGTLTLPDVGDVLAIRDGSGNVTNKYGVGGLGSTPTLTIVTCGSGVSRTGCITSTTYPSQDLTIAAGAATPLSFTDGSLGDSANTTFEFWNRSGYRVTVSRDSDFSAANIKNAETIFGVTGTNETLGSSTCKGTGSYPCVADGTTYMAAEAPLVTAGNIKANVTIAGITGDYPSSTHKLPDDAVGTDLTTTNYNTKMKDSVTFQWYDSSGNRYTATGDTGILPTNLRYGTSILGVTGTYHPACSSDGAVNCHVDGVSYAAADKSIAITGNIKNGVTIGGVQGSYPSASYPLTGSSGTNLISATFNSSLGSTSSFQWFDSAGTRYQQTGTTDLNAGNIKGGSTLFGVAGTYGTLCSSDGQTGCIASTIYPAAKVSATNLDAANIKNGVTIGLISGAYAPPCSDAIGMECIVDGVNQVAVLRSSAVASDIKSGTVFVPTRTHGGVTIPGITGTYGPLCAADGGSSCLVDGTNYVAAIKSKALAGNVKSGVALAGVSGSYGPACAVDGGVNCLVDGVNYVAFDTAKALPQNIKVGATVAGVAGTWGTDCSVDGGGLTSCMTTSRFKPVNTALLSAWDIRAGKSIGGIAGKLDFYKNMRTASATDTYFTSIDDYADGLSFPTTPATGWRAAAGDNWSCTGTSSNIVCADALTSLSWARSDGRYREWSGTDGAIKYCDDLIQGGIYTWRLPTQKELMQAYINGVWSKKTELNLGVDGFDKGSARVYWSATSFSYDYGTDEAWYVALHNGLTGGENITETDILKTSLNAVICVSP